MLHSLFSFSLAVFFSNSFIMAATKESQRSKVFLDIKIGSNEPKRITIELFDDIVPITAKNFKTLCDPTNKYNLTYKGNKFHRIIKGFMAQGGDITNGNGTGGKSIYGERFNDENFTIKHEGPKYLSMANAGPNTNGSQFFITFIKCNWLNGIHVVFGKVIEEQGNIISEMENVDTDENDMPISDVEIVECGILFDSKANNYGAKDL